MKNKILLLSFLVFAFSVNLIAQDSKKEESEQSEKKSKVIPIAQYFEGGEDSLLAVIQDEMYYPAMAKKNRIQGECVVEIILNADGSVKSAKCIKNLGGGLGEEAVRIAKLLEFNAPGKEYKSTIPVTFRL